MPKMNYGGSGSGKMHTQPGMRVLHDQNKVMANPVHEKQPVKGVEYTGKR